MQVSDCALTSLRLQEAGALAAVGAADGSVTLLRLCDGLVDMQPAEKQSLAAVRSLVQQRVVHCQPCGTARQAQQLCLLHVWRSAVPCMLSGLSPSQGQGMPGSG